MKTKLTFSFLALSLATLVYADITINVPTGCNGKTLEYSYAPIKQFAAAKTRSERGVQNDSVKILDSKATIAIPTNADSYLYDLNIDNNHIALYVVPGDNIDINITNCNPFQYTLSGSELADGMNELMILEAPVENKAIELRANTEASEEDWNALSAQYTGIQKEFISANPEGAAVGVALLNLEGEDFISVFESLPANFNNSILFPLAEKQYSNEKKNLELEKKQQAMQSGEQIAPNFTLKDLEGKDVSLTDFRGKWVILDFWGSWCPWCIKGFPELKEAYEEYKGKLEIIGIDCRESEAEWKAGVEKYQLPWVNVYNPENSDLTTEYGIQGYPTKAIIDPQGIIRNITVGHNPAFFVTLKELLQ